MESTDPKGRVISFQLQWNFPGIRGFMAFCFLLFVQPGCEPPPSKISEELTRQFQASGRSFVNLAEVLASPWERICIMGPHSDGKAINMTMGFDWPDLSKSSIETNNEIALLLFLKGGRVMEWIEHPRRDGDFTNLSRQCFPREKANFEHLINPPKGYPGLFPKE